MRSTEEQAVATTIITLMQGVVYREVERHEDAWDTLNQHRAAVADHFATIGVDVVIDETEGYAYLRTRVDDEGETPLPRLVRRRTLTYGASLLLVLLRQRMVEFETTGADEKLVLSTEQLTEMLRVFQQESTNDARVVDQAERTINQVAKLGFLRSMPGASGEWEVRRILKAYVDAETLSDFARQLDEYAGRTPEEDA